MNRNLLLVLFLSILYFPSFAQDRIGGALTYGRSNELIGVALGGQFFLNEKWGISPELNINFPKHNSVYNRTYSTWSLACDLIRYHVKKDKFEFYSLIGINLTSYKETSIYANNQASVSKGAWPGLNFGLGANFNASGNFVPFLQAKLETNTRQLVLHGGIRFTLRKMNKL